MTTANRYVQENAAALDELRAFVAGASDADLVHPMNAGWTVSSVMAHMAFWEIRATTLIALWQREGVGPSPLDTDLVNEVTRPLCLAIPPRAAAELALSSAETVNQAIAQLDPALMADIEQRGTTVVLNRALHRRKHLAEIREMLKR